CRSVCAAGDLLWCGEGEGERLFALAGEYRRGRRCRFVFEELGNPEVEQLYLAAAGDEHIRRLDVTVDNQVGMGVRDDCQNVEKQADSRLDAERVLLAIGVDIFPFDVLEDQVGLAVMGGACVNQVSDVGMREARENAALAFESLLACASDEGDV